ncbi:MAG: hypothetical protein ACPGYK_03020 [Flavobacteriales bacterium]
MTTLHSHEIDHPQVMEAFKGCEDVMKVTGLNQPNRLVISLFNFWKDQIRNEIRNWFALINDWETWA